MPGTLRTLLVALLLASALVIPTAALADPDGSPNSLQGQLDEASRAYNDAKGRLDAAKQRQTDLTTQATSTKAQLDDLMPAATPAPRNPDGSWPKESCSVKDPTTSGCLTPRTLHALEEVRKAGLNHYAACFRSGGSGEHPLGRACDLAANATGFQDVAATGADKAYGDKLAGFLLANADRLAVLYVIWYRQIWMPATGWRTYHGDG